jgi:hypothetical protein
MKKPKKGVTRDCNSCTQPEISKRGICKCLLKKIEFGKILAQRLVITAEKVWSHWLHGKKRRDRCSTGLNNVLLPTLFTLVNNIEQYS